MLSLIKATLIALILAATQSALVEAASFQVDAVDATTSARAGTSTASTISRTPIPSAASTASMPSMSMSMPMTTPVPSASAVPTVISMSTSVTSTPQMPMPMPPTATPVTGLPNPPVKPGSPSWPWSGSGSRFPFPSSPFPGSPGSPGFPRPAPGSLPQYTVPYYSPTNQTKGLSAMSNRAQQNELTEIIRFLGGTSQGTWFALPSDAGVRQVMNITNQLGGTVFDVSARNATAAGTAK